MPLNYEESATFDTPAGGGSRSNIITRDVNEVEIENQYNGGSTAAVHHIATLTENLNYITHLIAAARAALAGQPFEGRCGFSTPAANGSWALINVVGADVQIQNQYANTYPDVVTHLGSADQTLNYASLLTESTRSALLP